MSTPAPRALIAEDEPLLAAALAAELRAVWPELQIVATAANGPDALRLAAELAPDILFLDIRMPGLTGLEVAEEVADALPADQRVPHIVFVTAHDEFAVAAFERAAVDYVLKPVTRAPRAHRGPPAGTPGATALGQPIIGTRAPARPVAPGAAGRRIHHGTRRTPAPHPRRHRQHREDGAGR